jgi:hypothetical protein
LDRGDRKLRQPLSRARLMQSDRGRRLVGCWLISRLPPLRPGGCRRQQGLPEGTSREERSRSECNAPTAGCRVRTLRDPAATQSRAGRTRSGRRLAPVGREPPLRSARDEESLITVNVETTERRAQRTTMSTVRSTQIEVGPLACRN